MTRTIFDYEIMPWVKLYFSYMNAQNGAKLNSFY